MTKSIQAQGTSGSENKIEICSTSSRFRLTIRKKSYNTCAQIAGSPNNLGVLRAVGIVIEYTLCDTERGNYCNESHLECKHSWAAVFSSSNDLQPPAHLFHRVPLSPGRSATETSTSV